jgi:hypothetical protein
MTGTQHYELAGLPAYVKLDETDNLLNPTTGSEVSRQLPVVCSDDQQAPLVGNADLRLGAAV